MCSCTLEWLCNRWHACFSEFSRWVEDVEGGRYWLFHQCLMDAMFYYQVLRVLFGAGERVLLWCWGSWEACGGSGAGGQPTSPFFPLWPEPPGSGCCWGAGKSSVLWCKPYPGKEIYKIYMYDVSEAYLILCRDLKAVSRLVRLGLHVKKAERQNLTVPKVFRRWEKLDQGTLGMSDPSQVNLHQGHQGHQAIRTTRAIRATNKKMMKTMENNEKLWKTMKKNGKQWKSMKNDEKRWKTTKKTMKNNEKRQKTRRNDE